MQLSQDLFTNRELEIIHLFAEGFTAREIAKHLQIAVGTIRTHRQNALSKSKCRNMTHLVAYCIRSELI